MNSLFRARVQYLMSCRPEQIKKLFLTNRPRLFREINESVKRAVNHSLELQKQGKLAKDQIREIANNMVAPLDDPAPNQLDESLQIKIKRWAQSPPEAAKIVRPWT